MLTCVRTLDTVATEALAGPTSIGPALAPRRGGEQMRALRRRAIGCAAVAAAGAVFLVTATAAQAQLGPNQATFRDRVGNGIKTGQMGVQLFNYGGFISNGGGLGATPPRAEHPGRLRHVDELRLPLGSPGGAVRLPPLRGRHERRALRPPELPGQHRLRRPRPLPRAARRVRPARRRLARQHERDGLGHAHRRGQDPRRGLPRLRGLPGAWHRASGRRPWLAGDRLRQHAAPPPRR